MKKSLLFVAFWSTFFAQAQFRLIKDICTSCSANPTSFYQYNGKLYFTGQTVSAGNRKVYATDGTTSGTAVLHFNDENSGPEVFNQFGTVLFFNHNNQLYFDAKDAPTNSMQLVKLTNGTNVVTSIYDMSLATGSNDSRFGFAKAINNKIVYNPITTSNATGIEPHVLNVSSPNSSGLLKDIYFNPSATASNPDNFTVYNDTIYFAASNQVTGRELYKTDGTTVKTSIYYDINSGSANSDPDELNVLGGNLVFIATNSTYGRELFKTNGLGSYSILKDINPETANSSAMDFAKIDDQLYFSADNGSNGFELWKSDGTTTGTTMVKDISVGTSSSFPKFFTKVGSDIYFVAFTNQIWKTDGTEAGTVFVKDISTVASYGINNLVAYNGKLYFILFTVGTESELWVCDGTDAGTVRLLTGDKRAKNLYLFNNELYMSVSLTPTVGAEVYAYMDPALAHSTFDATQNWISVYPNPAKDYFEISEDVTVDSVEIYSIQGQLLKTFSAQLHYDVSDFNSGMYLLKMKTSQNIISKTLLVE